MFGPAISDELTRRLRDAGIAFHGSSHAEFAHGELKLQPGGARSRPGRVVALPYLEGPALRGIESDAHGFIPVSERGEVHGLRGVYAAGDATWYPIKHGGIAAQQADVVAATIAARAGLGSLPAPLRPVLRGMLLTGEDTLYVEAELVGDGEFQSTVSERLPVGPADEDRRPPPRSVHGQRRPADCPGVGGVYAPPDSRERARRRLIRTPSPDAFIGRGRRSPVCTCTRVPRAFQKGLHVRSHEPPL